MANRTILAKLRRILAWLRATGAKRVAVHFDVDVLDPAHYDFLLFRNPPAAADAFEGVARGRMRLAQVSGILNAVAAEADIVGLAITEYLPWGVMSSRRRFTLSPYWGRVAPYDGIAGGGSAGAGGQRGARGRLTAFR